MSLQVPHTSSIPFTLSEGKEIIINGVVSHGCSRFNINLCTGPNYDSGDAALHFNPRFDQNEVIRTHKSGGWGQEEKHGGFPFSRGAPYEVKIVVRNHAFQIYVNNNYFADFNHRMSKEAVRYLYIEGDTQLNRVSFVDAIQNPPVPFTNPINGGLYPGRMIVINGIPNNGASRFNVNLMCGPSFDGSDIALHFDARFNYGNSHNQVVRTHKAGSWGAEETGQNYFPFTPNTPFEITILTDPQDFKVAVNGQHFIQFNHRIQPIQRVNFLNVQGDVRLTQVKFL